MSRQLPVMVDPYRLADRGDHGVDVPLAQFLRVAALIDNARQPETARRVKGVLRFETGASGRLEVSGRIETVVSMTCQRCLDPVDVDIDASLNLQVVESEAEADRIDAESDPLILPRGEKIHCVDLLEDELLLQLPLVAKHDESENCGSADWQADAVADDDGAAPNTGNPFSVLKKLKK